MLSQDVMPTWSEVIDHAMKDYDRFSGEGDGEFHIEGIPPYYAMAPTVYSMNGETSTNEEYFEQVDEYLKRVLARSKDNLRDDLSTEDLLIHETVWIGGLPFRTILVKMVYDERKVVYRENVTTLYLHVIGLRKMAFPATDEEYEEHEENEEEEQ